MEIRHLKNIFIIAFGFMLLTTAYGGLQNLQSSLNPIKGMGVASLSVIYGSLIISSMFLPSIIIKKVGCKWALVGSMCCYVTYTLANFYPQWYTLIPTSIILGFGGGPLWASKCTYLTTTGIRYAERQGKDKMDVVNHFFGIFFLIYQSSGVWGNLISSLIFSQSYTSATALNYTYCGAGYCPGMIVETENSTIVTRPSIDLIYTLMGVYTVCGVLAVVLVATLLDQIDLGEGLEKDEKVESVGSSFLATFRQMKDRRQCLLIPLTMFSGFQQGFLASDYTHAYVTCALGIRFVGYVMICFGAANCILSVLAGKLSEYTGRIAMFLLAAATSVSSIIALLLWKPDPEEFAVFFIFPALWSMSDAICQTLLNALYGVLFDEHKEAGAFANYHLWESLGFVISLVFSSFLCVYFQLYIVLTVLVLNVSFYGIVEYIE
ncbi:protein unc-93 homolog A-like isoform X2 [Ambystoma mexicanum]|uniref:protein unc-93 homolog A-like isoform X2 n=1 Tax=Ambystoma mexicanum TaxID=8296 RepID=UPI0037E91958